MRRNDGVKLLLVGALVVGCKQSGSGEIGESGLNCHGCEVKAESVQIDVSKFGKGLQLDPVESASLRQATKSAPGASLKIDAVRGHLVFDPAKGDGNGASGGGLKVFPSEEAAKLLQQKAAARR